MSAEAEQNLRIFKEGDKYGLIHEKEKVTKAEFEEVKKINSGFVYSTIEVKKDGKWGVLKNPYK